MKIKHHFTFIDYIYYINIIYIIYNGPKDLKCYLLLVTCYFSFPPTNRHFRKLTGGSNRVKNLKRLLTGSEIRGYKTEI